MSDPLTMPGSQMRVSALSTSLVVRLVSCILAVLEVGPFLFPFSGLLKVLVSVQTLIASVTPATPCVTKVRLPGFKSTHSLLLKIICQMFVYDEMNIFLCMTEVI